MCKHAAKLDRVCCVYVCMYVYVKWDLEQNYLTRDSSLTSKLASGYEIFDFGYKFKELLLFFSFIASTLLQCVLLESMAARSTEDCEVQEPLMIIDYPALKLATLCGYFVDSSWSLRQAKCTEGLDLLPR